MTHTPSPGLALAVLNAHTGMCPVISSGRLTHELAVPLSAPCYSGAQPGLDQELNLELSVLEIQTTATFARLVPVAEN